MATDLQRARINLRRAMQNPTDTGKHRIIEDLIRAVAREEIERAAERQQDRPGGDRGTTPNTAPGGVRVEWTEEANHAAEQWATDPDEVEHILDAALPHLRVTVDRETLLSVLEQWVNDGDMTLEKAAARLGIHLEEEDND
jgi:hypothetical protein